MSPFHRYERGFSLTSSMAALAIITTVIAGTASLVTYLVNQSRYSQLLNLSVTINSQIETAIMNKMQYQKESEAGTTGRDFQILSMAAGTAPLGFTITDGPKGSGNVLAVMGARVGFDAEGKAHWPDNGQYPMYVEADMNCKDSGPGCGVAYRVVLRPIAGERSPAALGAPLSVASAKAASQGQAPVFEKWSDYGLRLSYDFFAQKQFPSTCVAGQDILVTGLFRTTGAVQCIGTGLQRCGSGLVADGVRANAGHLEMTCHALSKVQCPPDYVLQDYDFSQLDQGAADPGQVATGTKGTCVYRWKTNVPWQNPLPYRPTATASTATATVCNTDVYDVVPNGSCVPVPDSQTPGHCSEPCACQTDTNGNTTCAVCERDTNSVAMVVGAAIDPNTNVVTCSIQVTNECGSSMVAHPVWTGNCAVKERRRNAQLILPPVNGTL